MRKLMFILAGSLALPACVSGTGVYTSTPTPEPVAVEMPPVGVTIVRADESRLLVSTNQPAYLAVFEIVPMRGVTLVYPTSARQQQRMWSGASWLNVSWRSERAAYRDERYARNDRDDRVERARRGSDDRYATHYVYVVASDRPLRVTNGALDDDDLRDMLGARLFRASDPYETMAELSRRFVQPLPDDEWGEDVYEMDVSRPGYNTRVARVYCPDGSVVYVHDEYMDRAVCAYRGSRGHGIMPPRPDSVVASNGGVAPWHRGGTTAKPTSPSVFRVQKPTDVGGMGRVTPDDRLATDGHKTGGGDTGVQVQGDTVKKGGAGKWHVGDDHGNGAGDKKDGGQKTGEQKSGDKDDKAHQDNGNHFGWEKGKRGVPGNGGKAGNGGNAGNVPADTVKNATDKPDEGRGNAAKWKIVAPKPVPGARETPRRPVAQPEDQGRKPEAEQKKPDGEDRKPEAEQKKPEPDARGRQRPVVERDSTGKKEKP